MSNSIDYPTAGDMELVGLAKRRDMMAFEELVARHRDRVYSRAYSVLRNEEDAMDASQDAWIRIWRRLDQFQGDSSFTTWITRVAINASLDLLRKVRRHQAPSLDQMEENSGGVEHYLPLEVPDLISGAQRQDLRKMIDAALAQMSAEHRTVMVLLEFEHLGYKEIAERMKCSLGTVMSRVFYARRKLASLLSGLAPEEYQ